MPSNFCQPKNKTSNNVILWLAAIGLTVIILLLNLTLGGSKVPLTDLWNALLNPAQDNHAVHILFLIRLPRIGAVILCGAALSISGLLIQTVLHSPLASPGIIGVNSGAGFAVVLTAFIFPGAFWPRVVAAFCGALLSVMLVYGIARKTYASKLTIVLAGIAVSSLLTALSDALITINPSTVMDRSSFAMGGFSGVGATQVKVTLPLITFGIVFALILAPKFEILTLGDEVALSLGVNVEQTRFFAFFIAALLAASAVSIAGLIGFIGLISPHIARLLFRSNFRKLVLFSCWFGAILVLSCDLIARSLFMPFELPTGIVLSFIGAPFFLFLLLTRRRERV